MKVYTHCAKIQQNPKSYIKRLNITYNTGLGQPHVGSWGRGRIIWRLCTQLVVGREGINVNSSESLHNTGPQERVMELMHKNRRPPCFHTQSDLAGTQKDRGFVLMTGDHTKLLLDLPALGIHLLPLLPPFQALDPLPTQSLRHGQVTHRHMTNLQDFLESKVLLHLSLSDPKIHGDVLL